MSQNIDQIFIANPASSMASTDLYYLGRSPYAVTNDMAITWANVMASITAVGAFNITLGGTFTTAGAFTTVGAFAVTQTYTGTTNVTFPTSGTLATTSQVVSWVDVASGSQTLAANTGYITDNGASLVTYTLPATVAEGSIFRVAGVSSGGWKIAQAASQLIHFGNVTTTTGTGGSLASSNQYDQVELLCVVANTTFVVLSAVGNLTYV